MVPPILKLTWIRFQIVEFAEIIPVVDDELVAFVTVHRAITRLAFTIQSVLRIVEFASDVISEHVGWFGSHKDWQYRAALNVIRDVETARIQQRRCDVDEFDQAIGTCCLRRSVPGSSRSVGRVPALRLNRTSLVDPTVIAEQFAVIRREDDEGVLALPSLIEHIQ